MFDDDKHEPPPWDYFLTDYERDLLTLPLDKLSEKYPWIPETQMLAEFRELNVGQRAICKKTRCVSD